MASVDSSIGVSFAEIPGPFKEIVEALTAGGSRKGRGSAGIVAFAGIFNVENAHLRVARAGYQGSVIGMRHELDGEDIGLVASENCGV
jgi:hypothetical protein